jgi:hypothetical protein
MRSLDFVSCLTKDFEIGDWALLSKLYTETLSCPHFAHLVTSGL